MTTHKNLLIGLSLLCSVFTACRVGKDFTRPAAVLPEQYRHAAAPADSSNIGSLSWKVFFTDPVLQALIDSAIVKNYDLQIGLKNVAAAAQTLKSARMAGLPELNLQVQGNRNWSSKNSLNGSLSEQFMGTAYMDDYNANLGLTWEVMAWGKISRMKEAELAAYLQTEDVSRAVQSRVVSEVAQGYYNLLMLDAQLEIAQQNLRLNDSTLQMMRLQYHAGQINTLAIEQTETQRQTAAALIPKVEQQIVLQENALRILTGNLPGAITRHARLTDINPGAHFATGIPAALLTQRPDVHASELAVKEANARAGIAQASMYPALNITASVGVNSFKAYNWLNVPGSLFEMVGASIAQPVFQQRKLKTAWEKAKIEREKSILEFQKAVLTAVGEVSDALVKVDKLQAQREMTQIKVDKSQSAVRNAGMLFQSGMATYLEVITAQSNTLQSELDLAAIHREQLEATVALYRALGGGWK